MFARGSSTKDKQWWWATPQDGWKPFKRDWMQGDVVEVWTFTQGNPENQLNYNDMFKNTTDPIQNIRSINQALYWRKSICCGVIPLVTNKIIVCFHTCC